MPNTPDAQMKADHFAAETDCLNNERDGAFDGGGTFGLDVKVRRGSRSRTEKCLVLPVRVHARSRVEHDVLCVPKRAIIIVTQSILGG